jgi:hypothetical protein
MFPKLQDACNCLIINSLLFFEGFSPGARAEQRRGGRLCTFVGSELLAESCSSSATNGFRKMNLAGNRELAARDSRPSIVPQPGATG